MKHNENVVDINPTKIYDLNKLASFGLDLIDAIILEYFVIHMEHGLLKEKTHNNVTYYLLDCNQIIKDLPILNIKCKDALKRRIRKLRDCKILTHYYDKHTCNYAYYALENNYYTLLKARSDDNSNVK